MSYSTIKTIIEDYSSKVSSGIYIHRGVVYKTVDGVTFIVDASGCTAEYPKKTSAMVLGEPCAANIIKRRIAKARSIALGEGKMVSASVLVVDKGFYDLNFKEFRNIEGEDGRILGMTMKVTGTAGILPTVKSASGAMVSAAFVIQDPKDAAGAVSGAAGTGAGAGSDAVRESLSSIGKRAAVVIDAIDAIPYAAAAAAKAAKTAIKEVRDGGYSEDGLVPADVFGNSLMRALIKEGWRPPESLTMKYGVVGDIDMEDYKRKSGLARDSVLWCTGEALKSVDGEARVKDVLTGIKAELGACDAVDFDF